MTTTVGLIDDHAILRQGIKTLLSVSGNFEVALECANGNVFFERIESVKVPEIIILDINMPGMDGFETFRLIRKKFPATKIVIYSIINEKYATEFFLNEGAAGVVQKSGEPKQLLDVLNTAADCLALRKEIKKKYRLNKHFTPRELELIKLCATELSYSEIAVRMTLSEKTVENYRNRLFIKIGINSRNALTLFAIKNGLNNPFSPGFRNR